VRYGLSIAAAGGSPDRQWWLSKGPQEGAPHPVTISEACLLRHHVHRMSRVLHQGPRGFETQMFDRLCRRLASFVVKCTAELARRQMCDLGKVLDA
jgi:hypothetical protein